MTTVRLVSLPGDGVGPEVTTAALRVLDAVAAIEGFTVAVEEHLVGGAAIDATGSPLPDATLDACRRADAILLGAVGGPKWSDPNAPVRPEQGLLALRRELGLFANLRPVQVQPALRAAAPLRPELLDGVDLLVVRELTGGIYFGERREEVDGVAHDTMTYSAAEIERVARVAFEAARRRGGRLLSVDKANVLASMRLWRRTVEQLADDYPDVELEHGLVDSVAMRLVTAPASFDVVLAGNLFGDILSDEAAVLAGSLGLLPSASLGSDGPGLYEPVHGSAPDIAGQGVANPIAAVLSVALMLRHSLDRPQAATRIDRAVETALDRGVRTADLVGSDDEIATTTAMGEAIVDALTGA
ncbi:MAG: 3-isopropylmalate dehydrogenase [Acidobacteriota bacterium]